MPGRKKSGQNTLIGNAGEYFVTAELLKRRVIAALAPRNAPAFDILATKSHKTVRIRVKTKSGKYADWQWVAKKDGRIFRHLHRKDDFTVLVNLTTQTKDMEYFVVPTYALNKWLANDFRSWIKAPGKDGHVHDPKSTKRNLNCRKFGEELKQYKEKWNSLWAK